RTAQDDVGVPMTRSGHADRTKVDNYRAQNRGGKGVRGAALKDEDVVEHFFPTSTHTWLLCFTNFGRVYRHKGYDLQEAGPDARGQHVANVLAFQPDEHIAPVLTLDTYEDPPYFVLATKPGLVKTTRLADYDSPRPAGLIAVTLNAGDEVVAAKLIANTEDLILISRKGQSLRFTATDEALRPMGRA